MHRGRRYIVERLDDCAPMVPGEYGTALLFSCTTLTGLTAQVSDEGAEVRGDRASSAPVALFFHPFFLFVFLAVPRPLARLGALFSAATAVGLLTGTETPLAAFFFALGCALLSGSIPM